MIAIAAISEKLATIAARLTAACPGAPRSCEMASAIQTRLVRGISWKTHCEMRGINAMAPMRRHAIAEYPNTGSPFRGPSCESAAPAIRNKRPGQACATRWNMRWSSPARSARAGGVRAASSAGSSAPAIATRVPVRT